MVLLYILFCILVGAVASSHYRRSFWVWFAISLFLTPFAGGIILGYQLAAVRPDSATKSTIKQINKEES